MPTSVNVTDRVVRCSRRAPRRSSSAATSRVTADGDRPSLRAAGAKPRRSATATKTCMASIRSMAIISYIAMVKCQYGVIVLRSGEEHYLSHGGDVGTRLLASRRFQRFSPMAEHAPIPATSPSRPAVKAVQTRKGSRAAYARVEQHGGWRTEVDADLAGFLADADSLFLATASADGQPYIQHRGGPKGFIKIFDRTRSPSPTTAATGNTSRRAISRRTRRRISS